MAKSEKEKAYGNTLNLPKTDFPMRGNLAKREPDTLKFWEDIDLNKLVMAKNAGHEKFIIHDGPPYANGHLHLGHTMNKVLKDMINKSKSLQGYLTPYVPGWDTHGLPIELKAIENVGLDAKNSDPVAFRDACRDYALKFVDIQRDEFKRLGVRGDWDQPYLTLSPDFEAEEIGVFGEMAKKGYIYKGSKPVHWCPHDHTALAEAEIEYGEQTSPSIYVAFKITDAKGHFDKTDAYILIWTTTPWTLPANRAVTLHPDLDYHLVQLGKRKYLIGKDLLEDVLKTIESAEKPEILKTFKGSELEYMQYMTPYGGDEGIVALGTHVTTDAGTGCVHTAPGHGMEDFGIGQKYGLTILSPVDDEGYMTAEAGVFEGMDLKTANKAILKDLVDRDMLVYQNTISHQYPLCWRCKTPTFFRTTPQWFASIDGFRQDALDAIEHDIRFTPAWGKERIYNMIRDRGDWCISRQRIWGVPIPAFYCDDCGEIIINDDTIGHLQDLFRADGANVWFNHEAKDLLPENYTCPACGGRHFTKETDIMDVWFDSGSTHQGVLRRRPELSWPADLYLEGSDQHRGWFNSSLCTSVAVNGKAPYRQLLTHGFLVDEQGRKMSKSLGNGVDPLEVINQQGADILRLWVASADYRGDVSVSKGILQQISEAYRKIRNTFRFMLGSLSDFDPSVHRVAVDDLTNLDKWAMLRLQDIIADAQKAYEDYEFHQVYRAVHNFCTIDLSAFYLNIIKDRLYANETDGKNRRSAQTVLYDITLALDVILSPILSFTAEEVFRYLPVADKPQSVQLMDWPQVQAPAVSEDFASHWERLIAFRNEITKALEEARQNKTIGNSLDAKVVFALTGETAVYRQDVAALGDDLADFLLVSQAEMVEAVNGDVWTSDLLPGLTLQVLPAEGEKCPRCWKYSTTVGHHHPDLCDRCADVLTNEKA